MPRADPEEAKKYRQEWFQRNRHRQATYYSGYRERIKLEMVEAYGGKCVHCGEADPIVLVLDHVSDNGASEKYDGFHLYRTLRKEGWPKDRGLQLLCHNCNFRKEYRRRKDAVGKSLTGPLNGSRGPRRFICEEGGDQAVGGA